MPDPSDIAGTIRVRLTPDGTRVGAVEIVSTRPVGAARVFEGRPAQEVTRSIGRLFSLCGKAQTIAALDAMEQALGLVPAPGVVAGRELLRLAEIHSQTVMRLALHWPRALGLPPVPEAMRAALAAEAALEREIAGDWRIPGAGMAAPPDGAADLLPRIELAAHLAVLADALAARGLEGYGALPAGMAPEAGALSRQWDTPAVVRARARNGAGLAARLAASGAELAALPGQMRTALRAVGATAPRLPARMSGTGDAQVETARGPLRLHVEIENGTITRLVTEAPTEANFAPQGPVAAGLAGAALDPLAAELHLLAIDPCVACSVEIL